MKRNQIKGMYVAKTDIGRKRETNEDASTVLTNSNGDVLMIVADGMGGHNKGSFASSTVVKRLTEAFNEKNKFLCPRFAYYWLQNTIKKVNEEINTYGEEHEGYKGTGTTLVAALLTKDKIILASAGDSRIYLCDNGKLNQLTEDQTYVNYLVHTGQIKPEEAATHKDRHMLMNAIGINPSLSIDMKIITNEGKPLVLCSDGLYNNISEADLYQALSVNETPSQKIDTVICIANANGGSDNISIAYWEAFKNA